MTPMQERILRKYAGGMEVSSIPPALGTTRDEVAQVVAEVCGYNRQHARHLVSLLEQTPPEPPHAAPPTARSRFADGQRRRRSHLATVREPEPPAARPDPVELAPSEPEPAPVTPPAQPGVDVDEIATSPAVPFVPPVRGVPLTAPVVTADGRKLLLDYPAWWCPRSTCHRRQFDPGKCRNCGGDLLKVRIEIYQDER